MKYVQLQSNIIKSPFFFGGGREFRLLKNCQFKFEVERWLSQDQVLQRFLNKNIINCWFVINYILSSYWTRLARVWLQKFVFISFNFVRYVRYMFYPSKSSSLVICFFLMPSQLDSMHVIIFRTLQLWIDLLPELWAVVMALLGRSVIFYLS